MKSQFEETPLYIFDRKFDRKENTEILLSEYKVFLIFEKKKLKKN